MNDTIHEYYIEAGKIASHVLKEAECRIRENVPLLEVAEYAEKRIMELGAEPAFPCNISLNEVASHYTPEDGSLRFKKGDVVKIDIGAHIEGFIADTASTVEVGTNSHGKLIAATQEAIEKAISTTRDGVQTRAIGRIIEETIRKHGFNPVRDLTGHSLERYKLHAGINIPNYGSFFSQRIRKDMVLAIEPFATYGKGNIKYGKPHIFAIKDTLPFAFRWIPGTRMEDLKGLREYFELIEAGKEIVAQSEHTVIVNEAGCEIITK